tara:strand:- start:2680 stop:2943 length:264 start_codon:yes stop_codon:yes gene_type:complete
MFKEIKYLIYISIIITFLILAGKYYSSDINKKKSYRLFNNNDKKISDYAKKLPILEDDTKNIIEYVERSSKKKKRKFNFWKLLDTDD